jgi:hypothetical protein
MGFFQSTSDIIAVPDPDLPIPLLPCDSARELNGVFTSAVDRATMTGTASRIGEEIDQTTFSSQSATQTDPEPALEIETLCPFCGTFNSGVGQPCNGCNVQDNPATRAASSQKSGPWSVLRADSASAQEMTFADLQKMIQAGHLSARSVVRGPTTGQLWRLASKIRGLSREFGLCYCCSGDIENSETVCPHCDRVQTVPTTYTYPVAAAPAPTPTPEPVEPVIPETYKQIQDALFNNPVIHVHSLSQPDHTPVDPIAASRPVVAECSERHFPKDDLLTPRDVAKAFQLEFGLQEEQIARHLGRPNQTKRMLKIAFTSGSALLLAVLVLWPATRIVSGWINATPTRSYRPILPGTTFADARFSNNTLVTLPGLTQVPPLAPAPAEIPDAKPIVARAVFTPMIVADPEPTLSAQDDPKLLWKSAMEAEATGNYNAAVQTYERIESLPSDLWPAGLEVRLALARKELKGDVR